MFLEEPAGQVAEAPEQKATGEGAAVSQDTAGATQGNDEASKLASEVTPGVSTEKNEEAPETNEVEELLRPDKPNVQKRIDKLTAELKAAREELGALKTSRPAKDGEDKPEYTEDQLLQATEQAIENKDARLLQEIFNYKVTKVKDDLIKMYQSEQTQTREQSTKIQKEWNDTLTAYQRYSDQKTPEVYPGSRKDLNLADADSLIYKVSKALYTDPEKRESYAIPGGQKLAVADALTIILSKKGGVTDAEKERLKRQLGKEKQKNSPVGSGMSGEQEGSPARPLTSSERLDEAIAERTKFKNERVGF
jgi:hypothetical protein